MRRECPKCGSYDLLGEKKPDGRTSCQDCGYEAPHAEFKIEPMTDHNANDESEFDEIEAHEAFNVIDKKFDFGLDERSFTEGARWHYERARQGEKALSDYEGAVVQQAELSSNGLTRELLNIIDRLTAKGE